MRWLDSVTNSVGMNLSKLQEILKDRKGWHAAVHGVAKSQTGLSDSTTTNKDTSFHTPTVQWGLQLQSGKAGDPEGSRALGEQHGVQTRTAQNESSSTTSQLGDLGQVSKLPCLFCKVGITLDLFRSAGWETRRITPRISFTNRIVGT